MLSNCALVYFRQSILLAYSFIIPTFLWACLCLIWFIISNKTLKFDFIVLSLCSCLVTMADLRSVLPGRLSLRLSHKLPRLLQRECDSRHFALVYLIFCFVEHEFQCLVRTYLSCRTLLCMELFHLGHGFYLTSASILNANCLILVSES
jgi:hypothetical protein